MARSNPYVSVMSILLMVLAEVVIGPVTLQAVYRTITLFLTIVVLKRDSSGRLLFDQMMLDWVSPDH